MEEMAPSKITEELTDSYMLVLKEHWPLLVVLKNIPGND
jgi:hypothetical protein